MKNKKLFFIILSIFLIIIIGFAIYYMQLKRTTFKIELEYYTGSLYDLEINYAIPSENYVKVKENSRTLSNIKTIKAYFDLDDEGIDSAGKYDIDVPLVAYDYNDKPIENINIVPKKINVSISVSE